MCGPTSPNWRIRGSRGPQSPRVGFSPLRGVEPQWENRAIAFALISGAAGPYFWAIHSAVRNFLNSTPYRRIEATVDVGFEQGHRWIKMLGFEIEGYMKAYRPDGADMLLYARVR